MQLRYVMPDLLYILCSFSSVVHVVGPFGDNGHYRSCQVPCVLTKAVLLKRCHFYALHPRYSSSSEETPFFSNCFCWELHLFVCKGCQSLTMLVVFICIVRSPPKLFASCGGFAVAMLFLVSSACFANLLVLGSAGGVADISRWKKTHCCWSTFQWAAPATRGLNQILRFHLCSYYVVHIRGSLILFILFRHSFSSIVFWIWMAPFSPCFISLFHISVVQ